MSGQKIKIGNQTFDAPFQGKVFNQIKEEDILIAAQSIVGISTAGYPVAILAGTFWQIPTANPGQQFYLYGVGFHSRVQVLATGAEFNATQVSRAIVGSVSPINTNDVVSQIYLDGNSPAMWFGKPIPINYNPGTGISFSIRAMINQITGYAHAAGDTLEVEAWIAFSF